MRTGPALAVVAGLLAAVLAGSLGSAQADPGSLGQVLYLTYCQSCHGERGVGDGPAARSLRTPPADLTRLWQRYGTPLDRERLARYIDGRLLASFHGEREMPIWGEEFFADAPPGTPRIETARHHLIDVLIGFLESLQSEQRS